MAETGSPERARRDAAARYRFDDIVLDVAALELRRGGEVAEVQLKALDLLVYLIEQRHRVVERRELLDALWPDEVVGEASLTQAVKGARRALGDDGAAQRRIRTVRGRGYRFIGDVDTQAANAGPEGRSSSLQGPLRQRDEPLGTDRRAELAVLEEGLAAATRTRGGVAIVSGDLGIGKTTLLDAFAQRARGAGARVLRGRASPGAPPYWPWAQSLREYASERPPEELAGELGRSAADILRIAPELAERLPGVSAPAVLSPAESAACVAEAVTEWLRRIAAKRPLVVILEDLHEADAESLDLLRLAADAAETSAMLVVGSHRSPGFEKGHPLFDVLDALRTGRAFRALVLRGLDADAVRPRVAAEPDAAPTPLLLDVLLRRSDGNPFALDELLRELSETGLLGEGGELAAERVELPDSLRRIAAPRLDSLSPSTRKLLQVAAVVGPSFDAVVLDAIVDESAARVREAIEEATAARILRPVPGAAGAHAFRGSIVREVLAGEVASGKRRALHARIARELELTSLAEPSSRVREIAGHLFEATPLGDPEKTLGYLLAAARVTDGNEAEGLYLRALETLEHCDTSLKGARGRIRSALAALREARIESGEEKKNPSAAGF